jgi:hypothetical protein
MLLGLYFPRLTAIRSCAAKLRISVPGIRHFPFGLRGSTVSGRWTKVMPRLPFRLLASAVSAACTNTSAASRSW